MVQMKEIYDIALYHILKLGKGTFFLMELQRGQSNHQSVPRKIIIISYP